MEWDFRKINPTHVGTIYIKPDKKTKDEVTRFLAQEEKWLKDVNVIFLIPKELVAVRFVKNVNKWFIK